MKACTQTYLAPYFLTLATHLLDSEGKLKYTADHLWNLDETNCQLQRRAGRGVDHANVGHSIQKEPHRMVNTTVTFCVNAAGDGLPPQLIHKGKKIPLQYIKYDATKKKRFLS
jgi:hypothetical protein